MTDSLFPGLDGALVPGGAVFFSLTLRGKPQHKGRHRSRIVQPKGKKPFIHNYPDPETEAFEKTLAQAAALKMGRRSPTDQPLCLLVIASREIPQSWSRKDRESALAGRTLPTSRPDGDNYLKLVQDGLNGVVWRDDSQIIDARVIKRYSSEPSMQIEAWEFVPPGISGDK